MLLSRQNKVQAHPLYILIKSWYLVPNAADTPILSANRLELLDTTFFQRYRRPHCRATHIGQQNYRYRIEEALLLKRGLSRRRQCCLAGLLSCSKIMRCFKLLLLHINFGDKAKATRSFSFDQSRFFDVSCCLLLTSDPDHIITTKPPHVAGSSNTLPARLH